MSNSNTYSFKMSPFHFGDIFLFIIAVALCIVSVLNFTSLESGERFQVYLGDSLYVENSITNDTLYILINSIDMEVISTDEKVWVEESNCPSRVCVHSQPISKTGDEIICVPNRVVLKIIGERSDGADIISR